MFLRMSLILTSVMEGCMRGRFIAAMVFLAACLVAGTAWSQTPRSGPLVRVDG